VGRTWAEISPQIKVPVWYLKRWRKRLAYEDDFVSSNEVSDLVLDYLVADAAINHHRRGVRMTSGILRSRGE
jgi:hypothetical protein